MRVIVLLPRNVTAPPSTPIAPPLLCARRRSGAGPPHAHRRRGRPARAAKGRRAVALVSEIATPSNTSSPLLMVTAPPSNCTRADAERSGELFACMRSRDASRGGTAHATCASMCRMRMPCVQTNTCAMLRLLFNLLQVHKNCQLVITATLQVLRPHIPAQSGCPPLPVPVLAPQASTPSACQRVCVRKRPGAPPACARSCCSLGT